MPAYLQVPGLRVSGLLRALQIQPLCHLPQEGLSDPGGPINTGVHKETGTRTPTRSLDSWCLQEPRSASVLYASAFHSRYPAWKLCFLRTRRWVLTLHQCLAHTLHTHILMLPLRFSAWPVCGEHSSMALGSQGQRPFLGHLLFKAISLEQLLGFPCLSEAPRWETEETPTCDPSTLQRPEQPPALCPSGMPGMEQSPMCL